MTIEHRKASPVRLRSLGLDEKWLQDRIDEDPSILGIGDVNILRREKSQPTGGRIDFLMFDPDNELRYTVEIMLGVLDESHIIRAIEYWDIEKQRYPAYDHRAVIVAEEITSRFFNVIRLLNRSIPIVALQLNAFTIDKAVVLHFTKVLDVYSEADDTDETGGEQTDRRSWEQRAGAASLSVVDAVIAMIEKDIGPAHITYNKYHIALGTSGYNFCWLHPRKSTQHCFIHLKTGREDQENILRQLEDGGISAKLSGSKGVNVKLFTKNIEDNRDTLLNVLRHCDQRARTSDEE